MPDFILEAEQTRISMKALLKDLVFLAPKHFMAYMETHFNAGDVDEAWRKGDSKSMIKAFDPKNFRFSDSNKLNNKTGALLRSFKPGDSNTLSKVDINSNGITMNIGSKLPYASVHENGMFIKSKGKMAAWFFWQYSITKNNFFRIIGASVMKKGGVNIKARPYFQPAINDFRSKGIDKLGNDIIKLLLVKFNGGK